MVREFPVPSIPVRFFPGETLISTDVIFYNTNHLICPIVQFHAEDVIAHKNAHAEMVHEWICRFYPV